MHEYDKENGVIQFTLYIHALHIIYKCKQWQAFQNINSVYDLVLSTHLVCAMQCAGILHISFVLLFLLTRLIEIISKEVSILTMKLRENIIIEKDI